MQTDEPGQTAADNTGQPPPETFDEVEATYAAQDAARAAEQAAAIVAVEAGTATPEQEREVNEYGPGSP